MNAEIERGGQYLRPTFNHFKNPSNSYTPDLMTAALLESLRNLSEQNFECLIALQRQQLEVLRRIDRRLATKIKIRGHK